MDTFYMKLKMKGWKGKKFMTKQQKCREKKILYKGRVKVDDKIFYRIKKNISL